MTEITPPAGYLSTSAVKQIKLKLDANGSPVPAGLLVFQNCAKPGLRIVKYDRQGHAPMGGVTFELFWDSVSIDRYETNTNGEIVLTKIELGTYRAVEADTGDDSCLLDAACQEVALTAGGGIRQLVFFNDRKPCLRLAKTSADGTPLEGVTSHIAKIEDGTHYWDRMTVNRLSKNG